MTIRGKTAQLVAAGALIALFAGSAQAMLVNASFEEPDADSGDVAGSSADWTTFENVFTHSDLFTSGGQETGPFSRTGNQSLKMFGPFTVGAQSGAFQNVAATAGTAYEASVWAHSWGGDAFTNLGIVGLNFFDGSGVNIGGGSVFFDSVDDATNLFLGADIWTQFKVSAIAPAGTVEAQIVLIHEQIDPITGGSVFWDDADIQVVPVPAAVWLFGSALGLLGFVRRRLAR